jgi:hypothetical protein
MIGLLTRLQGMTTSRFSDQATIVHQTGQNILLQPGVMIVMIIHRLQVIITDATITTVLPILHHQNQIHRIPEKARPGTPGVMITGLPLHQEMIRLLITHLQEEVRPVVQVIPPPVMGAQDIHREGLLHHREAGGKTISVFLQKLQDYSMAIML